MDNSDSQQNQPVTNTPWQTTPAQMTPESSVPSAPQITSPVTPVVPVTSPWQTPVEPVKTETSPAANTIPNSPWESTPVPGADQGQPEITPPWQAVSTPATENITTVTTTTVSPVTSPSPSPWTSAPVTPVSTPTPPAAVEPPLMTKKKGMSPVITGVLAIFVVAGIAGGTYLLSRGVSSSTPIAPNAPASVPKAFDPNEGAAQGLVAATPTPKFDPAGTIDCSRFPNTAQYGNRCLKTITAPNGSVTWAPGELNFLNQ